ncbi:MAG: hypothetical protein J3R72DRAFT_418785 [Linnemannia gamsii]|nr:MAG: hypothetical protein J3R72DRAFT_418785 [Linnemannia gamsii]
MSSLGDHERRRYLVELTKALLWLHQQRHRYNRIDNQEEYFALELKGPCVALPIEIRHYILSFLTHFPSSPRLPTSPRLGLAETGSLMFWRKPCNKGERGEHYDMSKSWMSLVCANSYWICEACLSASKSSSIENQSLTYFPTLFYELARKDLNGVGLLEESLYPAKEGNVSRLVFMVGGYQGCSGGSCEEEEMVPV